SLWHGVVIADGPADDAFRIGLLTVAVLVLWKSFAPKKWQLVPGQLVAILVATLAALSLTTWGGHTPIRLVNVPDTLLADLRLPSAESWALALEAPILIAAATVALIASAETLLCASAVDGMHSGPRAKYDRELCAQGVGNSLCGLLGEQFAVVLR